MLILHVPLLSVSLPCLVCAALEPGLLDRLRTLLRTDADAQVVANCLTVLAEVGRGSGAWGHPMCWQWTPA
jgi:hypothetical protein